ncbi:MAG: MCP four helix bundle domain-containing protein [Methylomonas sp.]
MTIKQRMMLLVGTAIVGVVLLAGVGYAQIERVFTSANYVSINTVPSIVTLDDLRKNYLRTRIQMNRHILNTETNQMLEIEEILKTNRQGVVDAIRKFRACCISDDKDRAYLDQTEKMWEEFNTQIEPILVESRKGDSGMAKARDMIAKTLTLSEKIAANINDQMDYNVELGKKATAEALAVKNSAVTMSVLIAVLVLAAIGIIGWLIVRNLMNQLGGEPAFVADLANKIAVGDLSTRVDIKAGDTVSVMAAMKSMMLAI